MISTGNTVGISLGAVLAVLVLTTTLGANPGLVLALCLGVCVAAFCAG